MFLNGYKADKAATVDKAVNKSVNDVDSANATDATDAKELAKKYAEDDKKWQENIARAKKAAGSKAGRLFTDLETIINRLSALYSRSDPKIRDISIIALGDYYSSISVFGLDEATALEEAVSLGSALMENQIREERKDTIDHAWDYVCGWVVKNRHKFIVPEVIASNSEVYGKIVDGQCWVITGVLSSALKEANFKSEDKCIDVSHAKNKNRQYRYNNEYNSRIPEKCKSPEYFSA